MTRETFAAVCSAPGCRWARYLVPTLQAAVELARGHAGAGHVVALSVESRRELGTVGDATA